ncbi:phage holin family protein [Nocardia huaxiensis]|uniref:Phage holin family protein n=1 Tax=Nocardia huaxiensis TaxID=2755382 RepID=A0A7D6Z5Z5_9NOCA|nr:phage holin family protein [Nocardia huaxiensis]QLY33926.1 phage holin family protein [Nocardia huaxiensis]UFS99137.1 phage holin family protein [Nocardia huaxiensis]
MVEMPGGRGQGGFPLSDVTGLGTDQLAELVREQVQVAINETVGRMPQVGARAKLTAAAGVLALYGGGGLVAAVVLLIALATPAWVAALIVGVVLLVAAAVTRAMAKSKTNPAHNAGPLGSGSGPLGTLGG